MDANLSDAERAARAQALRDLEAELQAAHRDQGIHIYERTAVTRWAGETTDYGMAVEGLVQRARRAPQQSM